MKHQVIYQRSRPSPLSDPWKKTAIFSLASLVLILLLAKFGLKLLIDFSLFLESFNQPSRDIDASTNRTRSFPPILIPPPPATSSAIIDIKGLAGPGQHVRLFVNGKRQSDLLSNRSGEFSFTRVNLDKGANLFYAAIVEQDGKETNSSEEYTTNYIDQPPKIAIIEPENGSTYRDKDKSVSIKGLVDPGSSVFINNHRVVIQPSGHFNYLVELNEGENQISITAQDEAGNKTTQNLTLYYQP